MEKKKLTKNLIELQAFDKAPTFSVVKTFRYSRQQFVSVVQDLLEDTRTVLYRSNKTHFLFSPLVELYPTIYQGSQKSLLDYIILNHTLYFQII